ncbi:MAG: hypothetical protein KKF48_05485 [Nanoarchaeota archaeon]|nr:hypothetical protein [Nanoarchaeota archaeon]MBU1028469.1 hypothetical protein [Nanoarchaeota archaeon]
MEKKKLTPRKVVDSEGKVTYSESAQAWNVIKLKKELFDEFPELKEKRSQFSYSLKFFRNDEELEKAYQKFKKAKDKAMPMILVLYKDVE